MRNFKLPVFDLLEPRQLFNHHHPIDPTPSPGDPNSVVNFAAIGDYGFKGVGEPETTRLVQSWNTDFIITLGDNNYPQGESSTIDRNIGQYFHNFIYPYTGKYGAGSPTGENRFFPVPGNHDYGSGLGPYLKYFTLPGKERYYDFVKGPVHFFAIDSEASDGNSADSTQAKWLQAGLAASTSAFNIVYDHSPPYSSGKHGNNSAMQWPFAKWGADAVLSGDDHDYERIIGPKDNLPYFVNGAGRRSFHGHTKGSVVQFNKGFGAMQIYASPRRMEFKFIAQDGTLIDDYAIHRRDHSQPIVGSKHHHHHTTTAATATTATTAAAVTRAIAATPFAAKPNSIVVDEMDLF
jgi:tartrate-resistant acid phosphatase type 5